PYAHAYAIRDTLDSLTRVFPVRTCSNGFFDQRRRAGRPCLYYDIGRCLGPCVPEKTGVTEDGYRETVERMASFLAGDHRDVLRALERDMREAAGAEEFEKAARFRDRLGAARKVIESHEMVLGRAEDLDVVGLDEDDLEAAFQVFFVRRGRVVGQRGWVVDRVEDLETPGLVSSFLQQLYMERDEIPRTVIVPAWPLDREVLERWLTDRRGGRVRISVPARGEKRRLMRIVTTNAKDAFVRHKLKRASDFAARSRALKDLGDALGLDTPPLRIEAYDVSNLGPESKVGSMVVFEDGLPKRSDYRRFEIKGVPGQDDFASMEEMLRRRFARYLKERDEPVDKRRRFAYPPSLVVVDGGRGQLGVALRVVDELGLQIPAVGLQKRLEEVVLPGQPEPLRIPRGSEALFLLQHVRDEAHRFAIEYHRKKRDRRAMASPLDEIPGIGPSRKRALLRRFGSLARLSRASREEIAATPGVGPALAAEIEAALRGRREAARPA
ncbi:MAG TPA: excinuclease ABC subunit UvrC, partial [Actinomycetota bacterium]|nr:excinuclease ABC subunit UvrC [Actinomycetota bacterium]